jgi:hypothetical protein
LIRSKQALLFLVPFSFWHTAIFAATGRAEAEGSKTVWATYGYPVLKKKKKRKEKETF